MVVLSPAFFLRCIRESLRVFSTLSFRILAALGCYSDVLWYFMSSNHEQILLSVQLEHNMSWQNLLNLQNYSWGLMINFCYEFHDKAE